MSQSTTSYSKPPPKNLANRRLLRYAGKEDYFEYGARLYEATIQGDWKSAKAILDKRPELVRYSLTDNGETALHVAAFAKRSKQVVEFVKNLVHLMEKDDLTLQTKQRRTALLLAARSGNLETVKIMMEKNETLHTIPGGLCGTMMPLYTAAVNGSKDVVKLLYRNSKDLSDAHGWNHKNRSQLLTTCVESEMFDIALDIVEKHPTIGRTNRLLGVLARKPEAFEKTKSSIIKGTVNSGNKALLTDYQDIDGGFFAISGSTKGGKITGIVNNGLKKHVSSDCKDRHLGKFKTDQDTKQTTALSIIEDGVMAITATIDRNVKVLVTKASIRRHLKLGDSEERTVKTSKARKKARIVILEDEDTGDPSKQRRGLIQELDIDAMDKGKAVMQESKPTKKIKKRIQVQMSIDEELAQKKRAGGNDSQESVKKQKLEDDTEKKELKAYLDIVSEDEFVMEVEYLVTKADGSSKNYKIFSEMLDDFDRHDVMDLHKLVEEMYTTTSPEGYDLMLLGDLKTLFEPDEENELWKNQHEYSLISWRLCDSSGIHILLIDNGIAIHILIEKKYTLGQEMISKMLNKRKQGKLNPLYIGPFKILKRVGPMGYKLELPEELSNVHNTFHVSHLKKFLSNESLVIPIKELWLDDKLNFVEEPVEIMDREVKQLKQSSIPIVKVRWNSKRGLEFMWEREDQIRVKYPHLFPNITPTSN
uniref:Ankyrin repeat-containing domain, PGG domain protein n=1 Tax=Tanacetum cinerariifolium TaxID=118510 RepID=A0A6L2KBZ5_TANCI|nr:ankyrin repeat-containing domain, PGG domain protein [Tanacetum cinerariifolium]